MGHQLHQGAGEFATRRSATHDDDRLQKGPPRRIGGLLGLLKGQQHPPADLIGVLENLHRWRCFAPFVVAEVTAAGAGRQDQVVVGQLPVVEHDLLRLGVDLFHFTQ